MSKDMPAPLVRTERLLDLVPYLNSHQGVSIKELATQFGVTPAQISADLTTLWMCGLPGYTALELMDLHFESGYVTIQNAPTLAKPRTISFDEGLALLLGLEMIKSTLPTERDDLAKITDSLATRIALKVGLPKSLQISPQVSPEIGATIIKALESSQALDIKYHSLYADLISDRRIAPLEIFYENGNAYLKGFCDSARDWRVFRIDRILSAQLRQSSLEIQLHPQSSEKIAFAIEILQAARDLLERFEISEGLSSQTLNLNSYSGQWILRSILASGAGARLIDPVEIRAQIADKAQAMLNRYQGR